MLEQQSKSLTQFHYGELSRVEELEQRLVDFLPGGAAVPHDVRMAMAQISVAHGLDPFLKEVWPIPRLNQNREVVGYDLFIGISGWRNSAHRTGEYWGRRFEKVADEERKMMGATPNDLVIRCIIMRRRTGQQPAEYDGLGQVRVDEKSKMNRLQLARLCAERDAMKAAFPISIPSGMSVKVVDDESAEPIGEINSTSTIIDQPAEEYTTAAFYEEAKARGFSKAKADEFMNDAGADPATARSLAMLAKNKQTLGRNDTGIN